MANVSSSNGLEKRPKLRFPGFEEPWATKHFFDVFSFLPNNTLSRADLLSGGDVQNIHYGDVLIKYGSIIDVKYDNIPTIALGKESKGTPYLCDGDVIIADTAEDETVGKCCEIININDTKIESGLHTIACRPMISFAHMFLGYYMNSHYYHNQLFPLMQGVKVLSISKSNIGKTLISAPHSRSEQKKIVDLLHLIDIRIRKQQQIIEFLKKYKRGVLRTIFNNNNTHAWETVKLKEVACIYDGTHQTPEYTSNGVKFVSVENIDDLLGSNKHISPDAFYRDFKVFPESGDVLMTRIGDIGRATYVNFSEKIAFYVSLALFKCRERLNGEYLRHYISTDQFQKELWERTLHIAFPKKINTGEIGECSILLPPVNGQIKIAAVCSSVDKKIQSSEKELSLLQFMKAGLLQQLFI